MIFQFQSKLQVTLKLLAFTSTLSYERAASLTCVPLQDAVQNGVANAGTLLIQQTDVSGKRGTN
jgi:hypothetical protein